MSNFSVAVNEVLDRLKRDSGTTRENFSAMVGMPLATLSSYTNERTRPNGSAINKILGGLQDPFDAEQIVRAYLKDELPEGWIDRVTINSAVSDRAGEPPAEWGSFPDRFRELVTILGDEAIRNIHVTLLLEELVILLGLRKESATSIVHAKQQSYTEAAVHAEPTPLLRDTPEITTQRSNKPKKSSTAKK